MRLETFFEKFDQFADAPDAVAKMRALILQLAVRGELLPQVAGEGDAQGLLEIIAAARTKGAAETSDAAENDEPSEVEAWHPIPASWRWVRLAALGEIVGGGTPRSDNPEYFAEDGIPWLTPADLNGYKAKRISRGRRCITRQALENSSARLLPEGAVLFSSRAPIGYVAIAGTELATNQGFKSCVPFVPDTNEFLYYYLMSAASRIDREASGTTFREVSGKLVAQIPIPLPPLAEQKRIVAKVDELMALCDRLDTQQQEQQTQHAVLARASLARFANAPTPANLDFLFNDAYTIEPADLRKTVLTLAIQGKLVPQDSDDKPVESLVASRAAKSVSPGSGGNVPFDLPSNWRWVRLGHVGDLINGDRSRNYPNKAEYVREGVPWINTGHIEPNGTLSIDAMHYITRTKFNSLRSGKVRPGDLVYCLRGATLGKTAIITQFDEGAVASSLVIVRLSAAVDPRFVYRVLTSPLGREQILQFDNGSAQPNLSAKSVKRYWIPLPPLAEQRRIVAKVDQLTPIRK